MALMKDLNNVIAAAAAEFIAETPLNAIPAFDGDPVFDVPLVGFAAAGDPLFYEYKKIIGRLHMTPLEAMQRYYEASIPRAVNVIVWVLPYTEKVRRSVRAEKVVTSKRYNHARNLANKIISGMAVHLTNLLAQYGCRAFSPELSPLFRMYHGWGNARTNWSLRHVAYAAGLGTFSLNDGLITPVGISHRLGSLVTDAPLAPSPQPYRDPFENCLYFREGTCGLCIKRCPSGAITAKGHNREVCGAYFRYEAPRILKEQGRRREYIGRSVSCGLCQTGVPCEGGIPESLKRR